MITNLDLYPDEYFIFVNGKFPEVRKALQNKIFISPAYKFALDNPEKRDDYLNGRIDYQPYAKCDNRFLSPFMKRLVGEGYIENCGENIRKTVFPESASRITGIHAFGDFPSCIDANKRFGWNLNEVYKFKLIKDDLTKVTKANMQFISYMRGCYDRNYPETELLNTWKKYWSGEPGPSEICMPVEYGYSEAYMIPIGTMWEYIIDGKLQVLGKVQV